MGEQTESRREVDAEKGVDRLVFFSDAVIAISITLIVLPLVDVARDPGSGTAAEFFTQNGPGLLAAAVSFLVIGSFWREHHRMFNRAVGFNRTLVTVNLLWLAGIAFLPLATVLQVGASREDRLAAIVYIGTIGVTMALLRVDELVLARTGLLEPGAAPGNRRLLSHWVGVVLCFIAAGVVGVWPQLGLYPLLLMLLSSPIQRLIVRPRTAP
ncbi:TMEM175 family protein [Herbiconiux sp. CPCC 205763]|uniref:TMEM175 family protein n=1 Tax=Herbiconiux aconitum TaxID=2970913 RepID=A0ABT2GRC5_9MICO|nr:TMEM175 family protein [Herbiconiux aconitum]MCS5718775.1 TMEM175 family protein [Herbiconiux aconitum]